MDNELGDINEATAATLRAEMAVRRISGRQLAARLNMSSASLARLISGERKIAVADVGKIAIALDMEPTELLTRSFERWKEMRADDGEH
ncbi:helix-turn-helix domain-containing protein [Curtobacterium sp. AB451]|uniref:helix-turn-helix domain-containing protein n=1 Tax=Curtobacterium sp. AB451 TaxID=3422306 RepID=UPI003D32625C